MSDQTTTIVIFGASGDLTRNKLAPALADLYSKGRLGPEVRIVGVSRSDMTADEFRAFFYQGFGQDSEFPPAPEVWNDLADSIHSCYGDVSAPDGLRDLERTLSNIESPGRPPTACTTWPWPPSCSPRPSRLWAGRATRPKTAAGAA